MVNTPKVKRGQKSAKIKRHEIAEMELPLWIGEIQVFTP